jgi:hypothetical protein
MTEQVDVAAPGSPWGMEVCSLAVGAGATGSKTAEVSYTSNYLVGGSLLIAPLSVPAPRGLFAHNF